jgi:hypothetical protein
MGPSIGELYFKDNISLEETIKNYEGNIEYKLKLVILCGFYTCS